MKFNDLRKCTCMERIEKKVRLSKQLKEFGTHTKITFIPLSFICLIKAVAFSAKKSVLINSTSQ